MRRPKLSVFRLLPGVIGVSVCAAVMFSGVAAVSAWREASAPHVGDMIAFQAGGSASGVRRLTVSTKAGHACQLELGTLRASGGSFIVEGPATDGRFLVHWAGQRTSQGPANCGASADIVMDARQLEVLGIAALSSDAQPEERA